MPTRRSKRPLRSARRSTPWRRESRPRLEFGPVNRDLARLIFSVESADMRPADTVKAALQQNCDALDKDLAQWQQLNQQEIPSFNQLLAGSKAAALPVATVNMGGCKRRFIQRVNVCSPSTSRRAARWF